MTERSSPLETTRDAAPRREAPSSLQARTIQVAGSPLSVVDVGSGPVVVLGGSFLWTAEMWRPQVEALSREYRVIVPELWGHGGSGALPPGTATMRDLARQHLELLDQLGVERCALVGLSVGGMWGAELALMAPERVSALVLMDTSLAAEPEDARNGYFAMLDVIEGSGALPDAIREAVVSLCFSHSVGLRKPELPARFDAALRAWDPRRLTDTITPLGRIIFGRRDALEDLSNLAVPALVVTGADDMAQPVERGQAMAERLACPFVAISEAGHISSLEAPERVNQVLTNFLVSHSRS